MVALTPAAVQRLEASLGLDFGLTADDMAKPFVEMSGRRGIGVEADALLATLIAEAGKAIAERAGDEPGGADAGDRARAIAVGALRYQMARQGRNRVLAFDFDEALAFEGDTGPYLQYSAVRAAQDLRQARAAGPGRQRRRGRRRDRLGAGARRPLGARASPAAAPRRWSRRRSPRWSSRCSPATPATSPSRSTSCTTTTRCCTPRTRRSAPCGAPSFRVFAATVVEILEELLGIPVPREM